MDYRCILGCLEKHHLQNLQNWRTARKRWSERHQRRATQTHLHCDGTGDSVAGRSWPEVGRYHIRDFFYGDVLMGKMVDKHKDGVGRTGRFLRILGAIRLVSCHGRLTVALIGHQPMALIKCQNKQPAGWRSLSSLFGWAHQRLRVWPLTIGPASDVPTCPVDVVLTCFSFNMFYRFFLMPNYEFNNNIMIFWCVVHHSNSRHMSRFVAPKW